MKTPNGQYVVVYNTNSPIPLRHIITLSDEYNAEEFKAWYYGIFKIIDGDEFEFCPSNDYMNEFVKSLEEKWRSRHG